ncbi:MAG TPA: hypothetical protein VNK04_05645 [Gemmataceae bacterium]|nr:hypothetical protein [Gemmataceae bacterium]
MDTDYPAAHSMDTAFFAVDQDGHIAYFSTGEAGALPTVAALEDPYGVLQRLAQVVPASEMLHDLAGRIEPGGRGAWNVNHWTLMGVDHAQDVGGALLFLKSLDIVRAELTAGQAVEVPALGAVAVIFRNLPAAVTQRIHDADQCLGCFFHYRWEGAGAPPEAARVGLFHYSHLCENWISGPYGRQEQPARPLHIDQLPPELRELVGRLRFATLCFAQTPHIQPAEFTECVSWEPAYLSADGRTIRPLSMSLDDLNRYRDFYADFVSDDANRGIQIEPPPDREDAV